MRARSGQPSGTGGSGSESSGYSSTGGTTRSEGMGMERGGRGQQLAARRWLRGGGMMTPWDLMHRATEEMTRLLDSIDTSRTGMALGAGGLMRGLESRGGAGMFVPPIEVEQRADAVVVRTDLPGIDPEQINVTVSEGVLNISGERTQEEKEEHEGFVRSERRYGSFYRAIPLPDGADEEKVNASFDNGVLEVTVPLSGRTRGRQVRVESGGTRGKRTGTGGESTSGSEGYTGQGSHSST